MNDTLLFGLNSALQAAVDRRLGGRGKRIGSNADLRAAIRAGRVHVAVLDGIMSIALNPLHLH